VDILNRQEGAVTRLISDSGVVFEALTERQGQLRSLIRNSNQVFATTASRDEALKESFVALPTFEDESRLTLRRLAEFATDTDPLITQLRPAARELSPTLIDLSALAPDLKSLFVNLGPLIDASKDGFPAAQRVLHDLRPLLAQIDPAAQQLVPILDFVGLYKPELNAFFANVVGATQARSTSTRVHYLRTTNPFNPENLAAYPRRIGTNRPNPYAKPGMGNKLRGGMEVYEDRHCGRAVPGVANNADVLPQIVPETPALPGLPVPVPTPLPTTEQLEGLVPDKLLDRINKFAFANAPAGSVPAPPCKNQGPYTYSGETTQYPHVKAGTGR
jgi:phospholipid/cholesterol/gamma-HCH transport system substrate-binding protein